MRPLILPLVLLSALLGLSSAQAGSAKDYVVSVSVHSAEQYEGARLFAEELNASGGIDGHPLRLKTYEDGFSPEAGLKNAQTIAADDETLAVLGQSGSDYSLAAGPIFRDKGIPAVTPFATNDRVTENNPYYFRATYTDSVQGRMLAYYARNVLGAKKVTIISDAGTYGMFVADVFAATAARAGLRVSRRVTLAATETGQPPLPQDLIAALAAEKADEAPLVFVAASAGTSAAVVMQLRGARVAEQILLPDEGGSPAFLGKIAESPLRSQVARNLYVATPFIFDIGGPRAQAFRQRYLTRLGREPSYQTAFAYDAMAVIAEALRRAGPGFEGQSVAIRRQQLRDALTAMDRPEKAVTGITGPLYFDKGGNAVGRVVNVGEIRNGALVSSVAQLREVRHGGDATDEDAADDGSELFPIGDGRWFQKTNVAYTGIHFRRLNALDFIQGLFAAEFEVWVRSHHHIDGGQLVFDNAVDPVSIEEVRRWRGEGGLTYQLFTVKGRFRMDSQHGAIGLREHTLSIQYHHQEAPASSLMFIKDWMEDERRTAQSYRDDGLLSVVKKWKVGSLSYYSDNFLRNALGDTGDGKVNGATIQISRFNAVLHVEQSSFVLSDLLPGPWLALVLGLVGGLYGVLLLASRRHPTSGSLLLLRAAAVIALIYVLQQSVIAYYPLLPTVPPSLAWGTLKGLDVAYWLAAAYFTNRWVHTALWQVFERRDGYPVPVLMRRVVMSIIFIGALFGITSFVLGREITNLLATSGVVAMILGLALQPNLANIFSGIALNLEKPFKIGDWIEVRVGRDDAVGRVTDMNWRTTKIMTSDGTLISVPNGALANVNINNLGYSAKSSDKLKVILDGAYDPASVIQRLKSIGSEVEGAKVSVDVVSMGKGEAEYLVKVTRGASQGAVTGEVWRRIWNELNNMNARPDSSADSLSQS